LEDQGNVKGFFTNVKNADKLGILVEDIRDAMMEYQVCICELFATVHVRRSHQTLLQQDIYDKSCRFIVSLTLSYFVHVG